MPKPLAFKLFAGVLAAFFLTLLFVLLFDQTALEEAVEKIDEDMDVLVVEEIRRAETPAPATIPEGVRGQSVFKELTPEEDQRWRAHTEEMRAELQKTGFFERYESGRFSLDKTSLEGTASIGAISAQWPSHLIGSAIRVASCESSLDPNAIGRDAAVGIDVGLFQINTFHQRPLMRELGFTNMDLKDPEKNSQIARLIHERAGGWSDWAPSRHCHGLL